jgi:hypothetical protein
MSEYTENVQSVNDYPQVQSTNAESYQPQFEQYTFSGDASISQNVDSFASGDGVSSQQLQHVPNSSNVVVDSVQHSQQMHTGHMHGSFPHQNVHVGQTLATQNNGHQSGFTQVHYGQPQAVFQPYAQP